MIEEIQKTKKEVVKKEVKGVINRMKLWISKKVTDFFKKFKNLGFWILIVLMIGVCVGIYGSRIYAYSRINETILLGGFVYKDKIFTVTQGAERVVTKSQTD